MFDDVKKKVLFVATVDSHIELFHLPYLKMFKHNGYEVHVATNSSKPIKHCDKKIKISIARSPFRFSNLRAIKELKKVVEENKYDIIHCHTPMGGVVARLAARTMRKKGTTVIYTAHGFHFFVGSPLHYWLIFYPVEKYLAKFTDVLITINSEDYKLAVNKFRKRCSNIRYVPGVGVDEKKFNSRMTDGERNKLRKTFGLNNNDIVMICVGRLDKNKNQGFLIDVVRKLSKEDERYKILLVGQDELNGKYQEMAKDLKKNVVFTGFRKDISELFKISDIALSASKREGLPVNIIEAAMSGLPIVMTRCRGCDDIKRRYGGVYVVENSIEDFANKIRNMGEIDKYAELDYFSSGEIAKRMEKIYGW